MLDFINQVDRFQQLKIQTGTSKISSFELDVRFEPWGNKVSLTWGCYDIPGYARDYQTETTRDNLLKHMNDEISKMERAVNRVASRPVADALKVLR